MSSIQRIEEFKISKKIHTQINKLFNNSFGDYYLERSYYKQLPSFRYLVWNDEELIGHMAIEHRNINVGGDIATIFGVVDLCVDNNFQSQNIGSTLLQKLEILGIEHHIDFLVLVAQNHDVYQKNGFELVKNTCRWLMIHANQTLGIGNRRIEECLMVKPLGKKEWKPGLIDFLGYIF
jgi:N-acetylglutamate synthase-like GNAT family acetyltransferase